MKVMRSSLFVLALLICCGARAAAVEYFPLQQVRLLDGPFRDAQERNLEYVLAMDADRLLAPYLREAGLEPRAEPYGNWESSGLDGHIGGHYLTALSLAWAATGREDVRERLVYMLDKLQRAQAANGNGYLGGVPNGKEIWNQIANGEIQADLFGLNGAWVPWYNLHKIFAGLRDAWLYAGSEQAKEMLVAWADWAANLVANLSDAQIQQMLIAEHGGMNEVFADVAAITGDVRYLELAKRFSDRRILDPLLQRRDLLTGLHANTQIPKVVGFERIAQVEGNARWLDAAAFFWDTVVDHRTVAIGGNSVREHFHAVNDFEPMIREVEGPETCNTYNMLKLTRLLYADRPELKYVDYYERALYNHILASQDPRTGGLVYFTPMRPQHYRVYSQVDEAMWCCVGSGIENHFKYGAFIYAREADALYVNLFIPSRLDAPDQGLAVRQETRFPDMSATGIAFRSATRIVFEKDADITLKIRYPSWAISRKAVLTVNGALMRVPDAKDSYITLDRSWKAGDTVNLALPTVIRPEKLPGDSDYYAWLYGPIVLAAKTDPFPGETLDFYADDSRMGHIPAGPMCPLERAPVFVTDDPDVSYVWSPVSRDEARFRLSPDAPMHNAQDLELIPLFRLHHSRYMVYWPRVTPEELEARATSRASEEAARLELEALTIDRVAPGEQQPEAEHDYAGSGSEAGVNFNRHWRHATDWFGYTLNDPEGAAKYLRIDYWGADAGRTFTIEMNGVVLAEVTLTGEHGAYFVSVDYPLGDEVLAASQNGQHRLRFVAAEGSIAGGIYGIRLLRALPDRDP